MAFDFPNPPTGDPVTNPETGITYEYDAASDTWVVTASTVQQQYYTKAEVDNLIENADAPGIHEGETPPTIEEGQPPQLWYNTNTLELYFYYCDANDICAWVPTAAPLTELASVKAELEATGDAVAIARIETAENFEEIERIKASLGQVTLEEVLNNGNVADKGFVLTNLENDAILVSPEEGRIMVGGVGEDVVPSIELRHSQGALETSIVKLELDEEGKRFDVECDEKVDNIHFRFNEDVKLELNKDGDAVFSGGVDIEGPLQAKDNANITGNVNMKFSSKDGNQQLLTLDSGSSYLPMLHLKSFTQTTSTTDGEEQPEVDTAARKDVFIVRATGEAELSGHLSVMPGEEGNQAVTYNQLVELEEEIESIVPSVERGKYDLLMDVITLDDEGKFNLYEGFSQAEKERREQVCEDDKDACIRNPDLDQIDCETDYDRCILRIPNVGTGHYVTDDFANVNRIKFSTDDVYGVTHNWSSIKPGMMIDIFNEEDDSYMLAEVTATNGMWYEMIDIDVKVIQSKGKATGRCRIKAFELDLSAGDQTDFIRKQGANEVEDNWKITSGGKTFFHVQGGESKVYYLQDPSHDKHPVTRGYANANYADKEYVDDMLFAPARYGWTVQIGNTTDEPDEGNVLMQTGTASTKSNLILSRIPTVGPEFYLRQNKLIFEGKFINNNNDRINTQQFTVWDKSNGKWRWKATCDIHYMQWDAEGNIRVQCGEQVRWNKVDAGTVIYFNIAGFI